MKSIFAKCALSAVLLASLVAPTIAASHGVNARERNQQRRIHQGIRSEQLTRSESRRLERRERRLRRTARRERRYHHGTLSMRERRQLERRENRISGAIYRKKHNMRTR